MARKLRVEYPGAIYHAMIRGDRREPIFLDDVDRRSFVETLSEGCIKTRLSAILGRCSDIDIANAQRPHEHSFRNARRALAHGGAGEIATGSQPKRELLATNGFN